MRNTELFTWGAALLSASLGTMACAGAPPPTDRMASAEAEARAAEAVGAERVPSASLSYKLASDEIAKGRRLMNDGDNEEADRMFQRAAADAELSLALTRQDIARNDATRAASSHPVDVATPKQPQTEPATEPPPPAAAPITPTPDQSPGEKP